MTAGPAAYSEPASTSAAAGPAPRRLAGGAFATLAAQVVVVAATTVTSVAIARLLGPSGTGAVALITNLVGAGTLLFGLGLRGGVVYELSCGWDLRQAVRQTTVAAAVLGLVGAAVVILLHALTRDSVLSGLSGTTAIAASAALPFGIAVLYTGAVALAGERYEVFALLQALPPLATLVLAVALAIPFGVPGAAAGIAVATAVTAVVGWAWQFRYAAVRGDAQATVSGRLRPALRFGIQAWGGDVLQFLNYRVDLFILNGFAVIADVGVYSVAVTLTSLAWLLPNALTTVLFPRAATLEARARSGTVSRAQADETAVKGARQGIILLVPSAVVTLFLLFVGVPILYGGKFAQTTTLGLILLPGVLAIGFGMTLTAVTTGRGHPRYALYLGLMSFPFTLLLYLALIPPFHATGAALATTISYVLTTAAAWVFYRRVTGLPLRRLAPRAEDLREARDAARALVRSAGAAVRRR